MRKQLTEAMIEKLGAPGSGRLEIFDAIVPGLALRVTATGAKSFVVRGRIKGHAAPIRVTIGDADVMKVADAREAASEVLKLCRKGKDPRTVRKAEKVAAVQATSITWETVAATFIDKHAKRNKYWKETEALFAQRVTPAWKGRLLSEITRSDVVALLDRIEEDSVHRANTTLAYVRKLFNWAVLRGLVDASPIVPGMARGSLVSRDRFLTFEEVRVIWKAAGRIGQPFGPLIRLLLVVGQRRGEVAAVQWPSLDLDQERLWTLTPEETKAGRAHIVPLTGIALEIIRDQPMIAPPLSEDGKPSNGGYVFTTTGKSPLSGFSKAKRTLDAEVAKVLGEEAEARGEPMAKPMRPWRLHDLRRTVATHMEDALGIPPNVVGSVLNHAPTGYKGVTAVYTRGDLIFARRRALVAWARLLGLAVDGGPVWAVVSRILRPETEADAAATDEFRRMAQADETAWGQYLARLTAPTLAEAA